MEEQPRENRAQEPYSLRVGGFIEEAAFRVVLAWAVLRGKSPKPLEKRAWDKDLDTPTLLEFFDWTTDRHLFSTLVWPTLEVPEDEAYRAHCARTEQVKRIILKGAAEKAWSTRVEVTYGLVWDRQRQAWVAPDGFAYDGERLYDYSREGSL